MRTKSIIISPTAKDEDGVVAGQTMSASEVCAMDGALVSGYDADGLVTTSKPTAAGTMAMTGALKTSSTLTQFSSERYLCITSAGDDSGVTFTITGTNKEGHAIQDFVTGPNTMMIASNLKFMTVTNISISAAATGNITIGSLGVGTFADPCHVAVVADGTETDITFYVYGTDRYGQDILESITGPDTDTTTGSVNFATVTKVTASGAVGSTITIGSSDELDSEWIPVDRNGGDISVGCTISSGASVVYAVQHTFTDLQTAGLTEGDVISFVHATVTAETTSQDGSYSTPITGVRVAITDFVSGTVTFEVVQSRS